MYVRFVVDLQDPRSNHRQGIFAALGPLRAHPDLTLEDRARSHALGHWFDQNLESPSRFSRSTKPHAEHKALSWFKESAQQYIAKTRELAALMETYDFRISMLKTNRPGYVVFESDHQIVAEPYCETPT